MALYPVIQFVLNNCVLIQLPSIWLNLELFSLLANFHHISNSLLIIIGIKRGIEKKKTNETKKKTYFLSKLNNKLMIKSREKGESF